MRLHIVWIQRNFSAVSTALVVVKRKGSARPNLIMSSPQLLQKRPFLSTYFIMSDTVGLFRQPILAQMSLYCSSTLLLSLDPILRFASGCGFRDRILQIRQWQFLTCRIPFFFITSVVSFAPLLVSVAAASSSVRDRKCLEDYVLCLSINYFKDKNS
jgi:hypothetical protein